MVEAGWASDRTRGSVVGLALVIAVLALLGPAVYLGSRPDGIAPGPGEGPRILATGDSMMRYLDGRLKDKLGRIQQVSFPRSDIRIGSGISKDDWVGIARRQVREHQPRATVVFMGAADGFPMPHALCCGEAWIAEYARRAKKMVRAYSRKGRAEVYWLTLPAARDARRGRIFKAVNRAIRRAVRSSEQAHLVDAGAVFTPGGRYRRTMLWEGRQVVVRTPDGVHLTSGAHAIAAPLIRDAMRRDGLLP